MIRTCKSWRDMRGVEKFSVRSQKPFHKKILFGHLVQFEEVGQADNFSAPPHSAPTLQGKRTLTEIHSLHSSSSSLSMYFFFFAFFFLLFFSPSLHFIFCHIYSFFTFSSSLPLVLIFFSSHFHLLHLLTFISFSSFSLF